MATVTYIKERRQHLGAMRTVIRYCTRTDKTWDEQSQQYLVSGINCDGNNAILEFETTKVAYASHGDTLCPCECDRNGYRVFLTAATVCRYGERVRFSPLHGQKSRLRQCFSAKMQTKMQTKIPPFSGSQDHA